MVKQIRNSDIVGKLLDQGESYFQWLEKKAELSGPLSCILAGKDFKSVDGLDDILIESAVEDIRQMYAEEVGGENADSKTIETIRKSIRGDCCVLEAIFYLASSINELVNMTEEDMTPKFFYILLTNGGFMEYDEDDWGMNPGEVTQYWSECIDTILNRSYQVNGNGGLFPYGVLYKPYKDRRTVPLWTQMNDWVDEHTNEDGEWID